MAQHALKEKISSRDAVVGIIGLGYVGLPLAQACLHAGYRVIGIEKSEEKTSSLLKSQSYIADITDGEVAQINATGRFMPTTDAARLSDADIILICVPTPIDDHKVPDLSPVEAAARSISTILKKGQMVILESTVYPGCTEEFLQPILESSGLRGGEDFLLAFSPERVDPNNKAYPLSKIPKVVGGITPDSTELAAEFYATFTPPPFKVSSPKVAEMTKLLENMFRLVNISMINELSLLCGKMGIDIWETIEAAKTKPYGYMPFYPGPGVGGHCFLGSQKLMLRDGRGDRIATIEELYNSCAFPFTAYSQKYVAQAANGSGWRADITQTDADPTSALPIGVPKRDTSIVSFDPRTGRIMHQPITLLTKRDVASGITLRCHYHYELNITDRHPIFVWDEKTESPAVKFAKDVSAGDFLVLPRLLPTREDPLEFNLIEIICAAYPSLVEKLRVKLYGNQFNNYRVILDAYYRGNDKKQDYLKNNALPLKDFLHLQNEFTIPLEKILIASGRGPSFNAIPASLKLDADWARLIGYYLSEGCITKDSKTLRIRWTFHEDESEYIDDVCSILAQKKIRYSIYNDRACHACHIKVSSTILALFFRDTLQTGTDCYSMKIPSALFESNALLRTEILKGILRGDGGVSYRSGKKTYIKNGRRYTHNDSSITICYFTSSPLLYEQVQLILHEIGVLPKQSCRIGFLSSHGKENAEKLMVLFDGQKRELIATYIRNIKQSNNYRHSQLRDSYLLVKVREIEQWKQNTSVYSLEIANTNTLLINGGVAVHNCIAVDPFYLTWKAKEYGFYPRFIELAGEINDLMPHYVVTKVIYALNKQRKSLAGSKILIIGVAYKKDVGDLRDSAAIKIIADLERKGAAITYHDPYISSLTVEEKTYQSCDLNEQTIRQTDVVLVLTDHSSVDFARLAQQASLVVDTRNAIRLDLPHIIT